MHGDEELEQKSQELTDEDVEGVVGGIYVPGAYAPPQSPAAGLGRIAERRTPSTGRGSGRHAGAAPALAHNGPGDGSIVVGA